MIETEKMLDSRQDRYANSLRNKNPNVGKLPASANMNNHIKQKRLKKEGIKEAWYYELVPQYGLQNNRKVTSRVKKYMDEFGDTHYKEFDANDKLIGDTGE